MQTTYCEIDLDKAKRDAFVYAIKNHYWYQMYIDDLPIWGIAKRRYGGLNSGGKGRVKRRRQTHPPNMEERGCFLERSGGTTPGDHLIIQCLIPPLEDGESASGGGGGLQINFYWYITLFSVLSIIKNKQKKTPKKTRHGLCLDVAYGLKDLSGPRDAPEWVFL